jgi:tetratricopeptide (TPR) repeat protein
VRRLGSSATATAFALVALLFPVACNRGPSDSTLAAYARAAAAFDAGRIEDASVAAAELDSFYPAVVLLGKTRWYAGESVAAEKAFRSALRLRPSSAEARLGLARVLRSGAGSDEASSLVEDLLADDPSDIRALRLAAELATDRGETATAAAFLDRAAESAAETGLAFLDRARLLWIAGDGEGARRDLRAAIAVLPRDSAAARAACSLESALNEEQP